jgi:carboxyl-terminal processing protease
MRCGYKISVVSVLFLSVLWASPVCRAQQQKQATMTQEKQNAILSMLRSARDEVKKNYYDPKMRGLDIDARYKLYGEKISTAHDLGEGYRIVAAFLSGLKDSHTYFIPPSRPVRFDYGYRYKLVGNSCMITEVRPGTDAASKLHIGDQIVMLNGFSVNREDYHDIGYFFGTLSPQSAIKLNLRSPTGEGREVIVNAVVIPKKKTLDLTQGGDLWDLLQRYESEDHATRDQIVESGDVAIWKVQQFDLSDDQIEKRIGTARKHQTLILDLRGNGGGAVDTLKTMVGMLFDHDVKISDRVGRKQMKPETAKYYRKHFEGKLIVLVDSDSASASELLARVVQLEHRGTVIGDQTAGAVMESMYYSESQGTDARVFYGFSVTEANLLMSDGKSLENTGVTPDELFLPTSADLAAGRDPVLVHAAELAGVKLDPIKAGKMFPFEWLPL